MKSLPSSSPSSLHLIAPQAEPMPVPAAAPICLEDPQLAPTMPSKMPSEGNQHIVLHFSSLRYDANITADSQYGIYLC